MMRVRYWRNPEKSRAYNRERAKIFGERHRMKKNALARDVSAAYKACLELGFIEWKGQRNMRDAWAAYKTCLELGIIGGLT